MLHTLITTVAIFTFAFAFHNGAPSDTCVKNRANEPHHGASRSQSIAKLPFLIVATSDKYQPGKVIQGESSWIR